MTFEMYFLIRFIIKGNWTHLTQKNSQPGSKTNAIFMEYIIIKMYKPSYYKTILKTSGLL